MSEQQHDVRTDPYWGQRASDLQGLFHYWRYADLEGEHSWQAACARETTLIEPYPLNPDHGARYIFCSKCQEAINERTAR